MAVLKTAAVVRKSPTQRLSSGPGGRTSGCGSPVTTSWLPHCPPLTRALRTPSPLRMTVRAPTSCPLAVEGAAPCAPFLPRLRLGPGTGFLTRGCSCRRCCSLYLAVQENPAPALVSQGPPSRPLRTFLASVLPTFPCPRNFSSALPTPSGARERGGSEAPLWGQFRS